MAVVINEFEVVAGAEQTPTQANAPAKPAQLAASQLERELAVRHARATRARAY
ncbi:hypothetical protein BH11GEM2_BH11GEM2_26260 [soil metagenome]